MKTKYLCLKISSRQRIESHLISLILWEYWNLKDFLSFSHVAIRAYSCVEENDRNMIDEKRSTFMQAKSRAWFRNINIGIFRNLHIVILHKAQIFVFWLIEVDPLILIMIESKLDSWLTLSTYAGTNGKINTSHNLAREIEAKNYSSFTSRNLQLSFRCDA